MEAERLNDLAFKFSEDCWEHRCIHNPSYYFDMTKYVQSIGLNEREKNIFLDCVQMWTKNKVELVLSDLYINQSIAFANEYYEN